MYIHSINWSLCISVFAWLSVTPQAAARAAQSLHHSSMYNRQSVHKTTREMMVFSTVGKIIFICREDL